MQSLRFIARPAALAALFAVQAGALACSDREYEQCVGPACWCMPKIGGTVGQIGEEAKRGVNNLARELGKTPQAIQECLQNVPRCANEITSAPLALLVQAYIEGLYRQSEGRVQNFSPQFIAMVQQYYEVDLRGVTFADNIDTGHGQTVAYCDRIFFTHGGNLWVDRDELHLTLHELEHLVQCQKRGRRTFLAEYVLKGAMEVIKRGQFNIHDVHEFEQAAERKADGLVNVVWGRIQASRGPQPWQAQAPTPGFPQPQPGPPRCVPGEVFMATPGGACCSPNFSRCRNLTTGAVTCGAYGC